MFTKPGGITFRMLEPYKPGQMNNLCEAWNNGIAQLVGGATVTHWLRIYCIDVQKA